ncbi:MAG: ABC transporter ATP-binding protein [Methanomassiliicoccaceae archaeon]|jgi:NitT/TauT family transport system ATP-binding protein|nr:ABC transporter ATP-binding protein [Methanomassiliicoccaceae archaeon]
MSVIIVENVSMAYADRRGRNAKIVLRDIDIKIDENEFVCLIGPSGCGKTTLLNLIAGFERPVSGTLRYRGKEITSPSYERGVVFQEYSLLPWMNVLRNVEFGLEGKEKDKEVRKKTAERYLSMVGLSDFADHRPNLLSGGMKQRVAIARTLAMEPDVLLMDEPFSALDEQTRGKLDREILEIWKRNKRTVVFVTHNVDEALLLGTRIIMLSAAPGQVIREWKIDHEDRDPTSDNMIRLRKNIIDALHLCPCAVRSVITEISLS